MAWTRASAFGQPTSEGPKVTAVSAHAARNRETDGLAILLNAVVDGLVWALDDSDCDFRTFQYVHAYRMKAAQRFRARMEERFEHFERLSPVLRNVPPAYVLRYRGVR